MVKGAAMSSSAVPRDDRIATQTVGRVAGWTEQIHRSVRAWSSGEIESLLLRAVSAPVQMAATSARLGRTS